MNIRDGFNWLIGREADELQTRSEDDTASLADFFARANATRLLSPWVPRNVREAMGVPAVFRAVTLISNTTGSLSVEAYRRGGKLSDEDTPSIVKRPNPFTTPQVFWRDSSLHLARRGEVWWWVAARDIDDTALSLIPVDPREVTVTVNERDLRFPTITWRDREMAHRDFRQITLSPDPNNPLRGWGPLQACGAAVSVAVEAQEWAANFFSGGGLPSVVLKSAIEITNDEAAAIKADWVGVPNNQPRVIPPTIESVTEYQVNAASAQLTESREFQNGEIALAFGIPGVLMEHNAPGSSLTYQNLADVWDQFTRGCLVPNYLEPMEQAFSDLLTRATIARFSLEGLLRAAIKTRYEVYAIGIDKGIIDPDEARRFEGLAPGDVENRPVPFAPPQAVPASLPIQTRSQGPVRCDGTRTVKGGPRHGQLATCGQLLTESGPFVGKCPRCKKVHAGIEVRSEPAAEWTERLLTGIAAIAERPIHVTTPVTIAEGAIRVEMTPPPAPVRDDQIIELEYNEHHQLVRARNA